MSRTTAMKAGKKRRCRAPRGSLGLRLKLSSLANGVLLQDVARRAGLNVSKLQDLMRAKTAATPEEADAIAEAVGDTACRSLYRSLAAADRGFVNLRLALTGDMKGDSAKLRAAVLLEERWESLTGADAERLCALIRGEDR